MPNTTQFERPPYSITSYSVNSGLIVLSGLRLYLQSDRDKTLQSYDRIDIDKGDMDPSLSSMVDFKIVIL